ncbi:MAG TPA: glycosyltransferase family 4 protein [Verrucomicrobiae bacterium]|nr:glycosyltransferase family 4 protein [Verrucomicrobiae bacterium]
MNSTSISSPPKTRNFIVATPQRSPCDPYARALENFGMLRFLALGTRNGIVGVPPERTRLKPAIGLVSYIGARTLSSFHGESFRYRLHPWFDHWIKSQLQPGDHLISSYSYTNKSFRWARRNGGRTFLDAGNSHIDHFWEIISEEHRRWNYPQTPVGRHFYERARITVAEADLVLAPSNYVRQSFLDRGFKPEKVLKTIYPIDLSVFQPAPTPRPKDRPLTVINTGSLSLRKGTPYLLEAFKIVQRRHPSARLLLTHIIQDDVRAVMDKYRDLPIEWSPSLPHAQLVERLRSADVFVLPSLEEGLVRTALEAIACGLPAILTPHCGSNDFIRPGENGEVVPIRDAQATADAILKWADIVMADPAPPRRRISDYELSFDYFQTLFHDNLQRLGLL